jgi:hypothetical protein
MTSAATLDTASPRLGIRPQRLADNFLHVTLYLCILSSFFVFVQPAPYEYIAVVLGVASILARVRFSRVIVPLLILLLIRDGVGLLGLLRIYGTGYIRAEGEPVVDLVHNYEYDDSTRFLGTSFYLGITGVMFACMFADDTMRRIATLRSSYVMAGVVASLVGTLGYFGLYFDFIPGFDMFSLNDRAVAGFKDPNVLGCYLIPPLTWLMQGFIVDKIKLHSLIASVIIFIGLLLAFSRAAWGSFVFSTLLMFYLLYVTQTDTRTRMRLAFFVIGGVAVVIAILMVLMSIDVVAQMFAERARLQSYDVDMDNRSRILLQRDSWREILLHPMGMGPWGFAHATNWVSHNTYLSTFLNHGWIGGAAYLLLTILTLAIGFRALLVRSPWQTFLIASYVPFVGLVLEAFVIDTDHWRHFYLMMGLVWGLAAATIRYRRQILAGDLRKLEIETGLSTSMLRARRG